MGRSRPFVWCRITRRLWNRIGLGDGVKWLVTLLQSLFQGTHSAIIFEFLESEDPSVKKLVAIVLPQMFIHPFITAILTLGQASCLVLGFKQNDENRQRAKKQLQECGLVAIHLRDQDPMRPTAIGLDVFERDPFTYVTYPLTPATLKPTDFPPCDDNNVEQISLDADNIHDNNHGSDNDKTNVNNSSKGLAGEKQKLDGSVVPFCKERLQHIMKSIATSDDPANNECYTYEFATAEIQYELMKEIFPDLQEHCTVSRLQYWVSQSYIWGLRKRKTANGETKYGRYLWIVRKEWREFLVESTDSISAYWDHLKKDADFMTIGYARKSPTQENDASRVRLLQLMIEKLYYRMKCEEVFVSPCCFANEPILERDSPILGHLLSAIKGCNGCITDLTQRIHHTQKHIRLAIIDYAGLSTSPNDVRKFLETYPSIKEIAIDHGRSIEVMNRHELLERNNAEKFNCRHGLVKRLK